MLPWDTGASWLVTGTRASGRDRRPASVDAARRPAHHRVQLAGKSAYLSRYSGYLEWYRDLFCESL